MKNNNLMIFNVFFTLVLSGCTTTFKHYQTTVNPSPSEQHSMIKAGMLESEVHRQLGLPVLQANLLGDLKIERYYTEQMTYQDNMSLVVPTTFIDDRKTRSLDIWYKKGKVVKVNNYVKHANFVTDTTRKDNDYIYEFSLQQNSLDPHIVVGLPYDYSEVKKIEKNITISQLLWRLGPPNRVVNSKKGEIYIYEHGDFIASDKSQIFSSYDYKKSSFVVRDGVVTDRNNYTTSIDITSPFNQKDFDFFTVFANAFKWHAKGGELWEECIESSQSDTCSEADFTEIADNFHKYPQLTPLAYRTMDLDLGNINLDTKEFYRKIGNYSREKAKDDEVELLYVYRSVIGSSLKPGKDNLSNVFTTDSNSAYKEKVISMKGQFARNWVNYAQPNKWYFDSKGNLNAVLRFSLVSPMSPWYTFGPESRLGVNIINDIGIEDCTQYTDNCVKKLREIYSGNLTYPQL